MPRMRAFAVVLSDVVAPRGYRTGGAASVLSVERSTLASRVAMGTLVSGVTPTLRAVSVVGTVGDTISLRSRIAVRRATASCDVMGTVPASDRRTSHAVNTVTLWGEMVGVAQWLG
jgi:hypothetical protein